MPSRFSCSILPCLFWVLVSTIFSFFFFQTCCLSFRIWRSSCLRSSWLQALSPLGSRKNIWDNKKSPIWVYVSPSISQLTTNCGPLSRIELEIYLYKEVFRSFIKFRISWLITIEQYVRTSTRLTFFSLTHKDFSKLKDS